MNEADPIVEDALDELEDVQYEVVEQTLGFDVVAWSGKTRIGVLARTKHRSIADLLVRALFAEGEDAEA